MSISTLINSFSNELFPLSEEEIFQLKTRFIEKKIKKRHYILQYGDICKHYTYVSEGCLKLYKIDSNGKEHNLQFTVENQWISDLRSLYTETPSEVYIEAIEPSTLLQIEKEDLYFLYTNYPNIDRCFRIVIENLYIELQQRLFNNISLNADERYLFFLKNYPHLFNRISNVQISSFLGVTPEFLSMIRKKISKS